MRYLRTHFSGSIDSKVAKVRSCSINCTPPLEAASCQASSGSWRLRPQSLPADGATVQMHGAISGYQGIEERLMLAPSHHVRELYLQSQLDRV
jgi:hypothetical protein